MAAVGCKSGGGLVARTACGALQLCVRSFAGAFTSGDSEQSV